MSLPRTASSKKALQVKSSKAQIRRRYQSKFDVEFSSSNQLTAFAGLVLLDDLIRALDLRRRLRAVFREKRNGRIFAAWRNVLLVVVHFSLGFRRMRQMRWYRTDPLVHRLVGVSVLPDERTVNRTLGSVSGAEEERFDELIGTLVTERLARQRFKRVFIDFDGSVISTAGHAEGSAVGFNKARKGERSYYPLFCTVAETSQFLSMLHRAGNVHDSNGACEFIARNVELIRKSCPQTAVLARLDSAFMSQDVVETLQMEKVCFTISAPFERLPALKRLIENRKRWRRADKATGFFETNWCPKSWKEVGPQRMIFVRHRRREQLKGPLQLDLFRPVHHRYEYQVIMTNDRKSDVATLIARQQGRGAQEKLFGEAKQNAALSVVHGRHLVLNRMGHRISMLTHNLSRELQIRANAPRRDPSPVATARWRFSTLRTLSNTLIRQAGAIVRPQGRAVIRMNRNDHVMHAFQSIRSALRTREMDPPSAGLPD